MTTYKYIGDGAGIPGLPHQITDAEIAALDPEQTKAWKSALASGAYLEQSDVKPSVKSKTKRADAPTTAEGE